MVRMRLLIVGVSVVEFDIMIELMLSLWLSCFVG